MKALLALALCACGGPTASVIDVPAETTTVTLVGTTVELHGRAAIDAAIAKVRAQFPGAKLVPGRAWTSAHASVREYVFTARGIGVVCAVVTTGSAMRIYIDLVTLFGQRDPASIGDAKIRTPVADPPDGMSIRHGTSKANLALTDAIWDALDRHDAAAVLASAAPDYIYDDFSGPAPLDKAATQALVASFVGAVGDFKIVEKPVQFAADDDVITEMVEHATFRGKPITLHSLDVKRFANGTVVREWQYANGDEVLVELFGKPPLVP